MEKWYNNNGGILLCTYIGTRRCEWVSDMFVKEKENFGRSILDKNAGIKGWAYAESIFCSFNMIDMSLNIKN